MAADADTALEFSRQGRSWRVIAALIAIYAGLLGATLVVDASRWVTGALALLTLPALWEVCTNPGAGMRLGAQQLSWHSARRHGKIGLGEIDHMRFDTRWDFSVRVSAVLHGGTRVRLPDESLPPHRMLEAAFQERGIPVKRHHFAVL